MEELYTIISKRDGGEWAVHGDWCGNDVVGTIYFDYEQAKKDFARVCQEMRQFYSLKIVEVRVNK